ncbi:MAG TPA: hypothetical protein VM554_13210 [Acidisarcina sp.]|nr:hypothetical protein [Acidisarcina sp.]
MTYWDPENRAIREVQNVQDSASELFQTAAMLLGKEQEAVSVIEEVVAETEGDPCGDPRTAHQAARERVIAASLKRLAKYPAGGLDAELAAGGTTQRSCIESEDLEAAGVTVAQLESLMEGPGRARLREWLDRLSPAMRAVFVLRAVLGRGSAISAEALQASGSRGASAWTPSTVSQVYRQALCSLATSLLHCSHAAISRQLPAKS